MKDLRLLNNLEDFYAVDNDFVVENHDLKLIENEEKIVQDITKFLLTIKGSNFLFKNYGTQISKIIGTRKINDITDELKQEIIYTLKYVKEINKDEKINIQEILSLNIKNNINYYAIELVILLTNNKTLTIKI